MSRDDAAILDIHEYDEVDLHGVWRTLASDLPELIQAIQPLSLGRPPTEAT